jgi:SNF2 family DNA or RNA helicase
MPDLKPVFQEHFVMPDMDHITYYKYWLENFANWFREQLRLQKIDSSHNISTAIILAHLTKLNFASTIPQSHQINKDNSGPAWTHGLTPKQEKVIELVKEAVSNDEKVIVFSGRPDFQEHMQRHLAKKGIHGHVFTGRQTTTDRVLILEDFKTNPDVSVLFATTTCGDTGLNIPEASTVIFADVNWTPSKTRQAYSRILRPDQEKEPHIHMIYNKGMIDEYMLQLCNMKSEGIDQAIDGHDAEEFDPETWMSYKDFSYKMLKELGML